MPRRRQTCCPKRKPVDDLPGERQAQQAIARHADRLDQAQSLPVRTDEEMLADPTLWAQTIHPDDRDRITEAVRRHNQGEPFEVEYVNVTSDVVGLDSVAFRWAVVLEPVPSETLAS